MSNCGLFFMNTGTKYSHSTYHINIFQLPRTSSRRKHSAATQSIHKKMLMSNSNSCANLMLFVCVFNIVHTYYKQTRTELFKFC